MADLSPSPATHPAGYAGPTWGGTPGWDWKPVTPSQLSTHADHSRSPYRALADDAGAEVPALYALLRRGTIWLIELVIEEGMAHLNNPFVVAGDARRHARLVEAIAKRDPAKTVLTVSNHCCTLDDPILFGKLLPPALAGEARSQRWSLCSQEVCFRNPALATFFGAGKVLPIKRGVGVDQPQLLDFARKAAQGGQWLHLFPEGKIYQSGSLAADYFLARSDGRAAEIGRMKWGAGKIIAHCPRRMVVVPFHHAGMEGVVPQYETGHLKTTMPMGGHDGEGATVTARFGEPIEFGDLIEEHEREHGKLWKYKARREEGERWESSGADKLLYSRIMRRIEARLKELEGESKRDGGEAARASRKVIRDNLATPQRPPNTGGGGYKEEDVP
ncbi:hypothetical protein TeGR_g13340 [Tetraparma gracilis]|uniref:Tafazzin family protein n=1 Tax=Tetraparma gracilis TaxID=2962635 RepID=A0ABQ6MA78_9STRA|nr:hypothetical protein TeGR_g13340 [Tetraparma gracilis]